MSYKGIRRRPQYSKTTITKPENIKRRFIFTLIFMAVLAWATLIWILPFLVNSVGFVANVFKPTKNVSQIADNASLAPPTLNIPFEATNTAEITISGYAAPNSKVEIYLENELKDTAKVSDEGSFTSNLIELAMGTNNITGKTVDDKNRESLPSKIIRVIYDNEKPELEISEPEDGRQVQSIRELKISGKTEPDAKVYINDSQVIVNSEGNFSTQVSLSDGENNFNIKAVDKAGNNKEESRRVNFTP